MGEPVNWEKTLQIVIDVILSEGGIPNNMYRTSRKQIPIVAVNTVIIDSVSLNENNSRFVPRLRVSCLSFRWLFMPLWDL